MFTVTEDRVYISPSLTNRTHKRCPFPLIVAKASSPSVGVLRETPSSLLWRVLGSRRDGFARRRRRLRTLRAASAGSDGDGRAAGRSRIGATRTPRRRAGAAEASWPRRPPAAAASWSAGHGRVFRPAQLRTRYRRGGGGFELQRDRGRVSHRCCHSCS